MEERKKVLQLCAVGFTVEKLLLPLINEMSKDYAVTIAYGEDETTERLKSQGYKIENFFIGRRIAPFANLKTIVQLYKHMKREKYDIVHVHTPVAGLLGRIAAKLAGVPVIIYTAHGFYFHDNMTSLKKKSYILFEKVGGWFCDYIFTQSQEDYDTAVREKIVPPEKISVIGNGVDISKFKIDENISPASKQKIKDEFNIKPEDKVVTIIGRVVKEKGYLEWLQASKEVVKKYSNVKFLAVGPNLESDRDGIKDELDLFIKENALERNVVFAGSRTDIPDILAITDVFTLPSYREGMPRSLIEAMCMSVPAVATDIRGCREEVVEGVTGFLVPVKEYKGLAEKIIYLLDNPDIAKKMGSAARERAEKEFDEKVVLSRQLNIIKKLANSKL